MLSRRPPLTIQEVSGAFWAALPKKFKPLGRKLVTGNANQGWHVKLNLTGNKLV